MAWLACCLLLPGRAAGAAIVMLNERSDISPTEQQVSYLVDEPGKLQIGDIGRERVQKRFRPVPGGSISFGFDPRVHWFRMEVENTAGSLRHYFLEARYPLIDSIGVYLVGADGSVRTHALGDRQAYHERILPMHMFVVPLELRAGERLQIYLRVQTTGALDLPLRIAAENRFLVAVHDTEWMIGVFYGVILGLLAYNVFIFLTTRERAFLYYVSYLLMTFAYMAAFDGILFRIFPDSITWQQYSIYVCANGSLVFLVLFSVAYLQLDRGTPMQSRLAQAVLAVNVASILSHPVLEIGLSARLAALIGITSFVVLLGIGAARLLQGYRPARIYVLAFSAFLLVGSVTLLGAFGVLPIFETGRAWVKVGILLQLILLSLALGDRINALKEEQLRTRQEAIEAEAHSRATSEFLARMSHEIRTPMNGVLGMAELMADTELSRSQRHYLEVISGSGRALLGVINDILDFSKIEAGHMELDLVDTNLEQLLNECVAVFSLKADERRLEFALSIAPGTPLAVQVDPTRLRQVILNLLGNAFKFTEKGHVLLRVRSGGTDRLHFEVVDSGIGIPAAAQEKLFDSFTQADVSTTRRYGGTGLGLAITRQLIGLMGGEIGIDSEPGRGSTFWFHVPAVAARRPERLAPYKRPDLPLCRVLMVTGRTLVGELLTREMSAFEVHLVVVDDEARAQAEIGARRQSGGGEFRLVIVDRHLPGINGLAVARRLGEQVDRGRTRMVLMTGLRETEDGASLEEAGVDTCIDYPLSGAQFRESLALVLQVGEPAGTPANEPADRLPDYGGYRFLVVDDNDVNLLVIRGMLKKLGVDPDTATNGREAVEAVRKAGTPYDFILLDCEMPEMDGYEATAAIRDLETDSDRQSVIIALSAHVMAEARQKSIDAGMDDHMSKPVSMKILRQKLAQWSGALA